MRFRGKSLAWHYLLLKLDCTLLHVFDWQSMEFCVLFCCSMESESVCAYCFWTLYKFQMWLWITFHTGVITNDSVCHVNRPPPPPPPRVKQRWVMMHFHISSGFWLTNQLSQIRHQSCFVAGVGLNWFHGHFRWWQHTWYRRQLSLFYGRLSKICDLQWFKFCAKIYAWMFLTLSN